MNYKVLWFDDLIGLGERYKDVMQTHGIDVESVSDPNDFKNRIEGTPKYHAIIIDLKMENFNPIKYLMEKKKTHHNLPICIISGYASEDGWSPQIEDFEKYYDIVTVIPKPIPRPTNSSFKRLVIDTILSQVDIDGHEHDFKKEKQNALNQAGSGQMVPYDAFLKLPKPVRKRLLETISEDYFVKAQEHLAAKKLDWALVLSDGTIEKDGLDGKNEMSEEEVINIGEKTQAIPLIIRRADTTEFEEFEEHSKAWPNKGKDYYPTISYRINDQLGGQKGFRAHFDTGSERTWYDAGHFIDLNIVEDSLKEEATSIRGKKIHYFERPIKLILTDGKRDRSITVPIRFVQNWPSIDFFRSNKFGNRYSLIGRNILFHDKGVNLVLKGRDKVILVYSPDK